MSKHLHAEVLYPSLGPSLLIGTGLAQRTIPRPEGCLCDGKGWYVVDIDNTDYAKPCPVCKRGQQESLFPAPAKYRGILLHQIIPDPKKHPKQYDVLREIKDYPHACYVITGRPGSGKTHFAWGLSRYAHDKGAPFYGGLAPDLMDEYRDFERGHGPKPSLCPKLLSNLKKRAVILLDDLDKIRTTEFVFEILFRIIDAATNNSHQLIVTSNLGWNDLEDFMRAKDQVYGVSIMRRLSECRTVEMF